MAERTPGPWKWHWRTNGDGKPECGIFAEPRDGHAYSVARCPQYQSRKKWEADAAFIVKAANNHDALVKALKAALLIAKQEWDFPGAHPHRAAVVRDMEDALAHVSGAGDDK